MLLVLVHDNDLELVYGDFEQMQAHAQVHEVEDVLLETRAAEADGRAQKRGPDAAITPNRVSDLVDVRTC